jgi:hypothetical protein
MSEMLGLKEQDSVEINFAFPFNKGNAMNRIRILAASGPLLLSIPVKKTPANTPVSQIQIDHEQKWQNQHWRSITSAYGKAPFFVYFKDELEHLFGRKTEGLAEFTSGIMEWTLKQYFPKDRLSVNLSGEFLEPGRNNEDLKWIEKSSFDAGSRLQYRQVFGSEFVPDLSVIDHLFCSGPNDFWKPRN